MKNFLKKFKKRRNVLIAVVVLVLIGIVGFFLFFRGNGEAKMITAPAGKQTISTTVVASGNVVPLKIQNAGFKTAGRITEILVKVGDTVKAGQALAKLDTSALSNNLTQSQASLNQAKNNLASAKVTGYRTKYELDNLAQAVVSAQARVNNDQEALNNATLNSLIEGVVLNINSNVGDNVTAAGNNSSVISTSLTSAIMTVVDPNSFFAALNIGEGDINRIKAGQSVKITLDAVSGKSYAGKVTQVSTLGVINSNVVSYGIKVAFDKVDADVKTGMSLNAEIAIETRENVIAVPNTAIRTVGENKFVQVMKNNRPVMVAVKTGLANDTHTEILEGINEGDLIVVTTIIDPLFKQGTINFQRPQGITSSPGGSQQVFINK